MGSFNPLDSPVGLALSLQVREVRLSLCPPAQPRSVLRTLVVLSSGNHFPPMLTLLWEWELPLFIDPYSWAALIGVVMDF